MNVVCNLILLMGLGSIIREPVICSNSTQCFIVNIVKRKMDNKKFALNMSRCMLLTTRNLECDGVLYIEMA